MMTKPASPSPTLNMCPFFHAAQQERQYPLLGLCRALPRNQIMIPTLEEYRACCSTPGHTTCSVFRSGMGEIDEPDWLDIGYAEWAWRPLALSEGRPQESPRALPLGHCAPRARKCA